MSHNNIPQKKSITDINYYSGGHLNRGKIKSNEKLSSISKASIFIAACWSGYFGMGVELLGGRLLAPFFGSSIFVWGGIITVFMVCLSIGYLVGGWFSTKVLSLKILGALLLMEALFAVPIITIGDLIMENITLYIDDVRYGSLLGSLFLFGLPTIISGMVSPYAVRLLVTDVHTSGKAAGRLYFASTIGSATGTIVTSFYLVLYFEVNYIIGFYISISAFIGAWLMQLKKR